ncbi:MAG: two-component sensor histidine kinase [Planctomycetes bacterium]|nr:two-component sensor histidine kinase [Planctomycetota bacterium]NBY00468.1 two-component sensor histidine kinase [Planctomycetota bacterium]
MSDPYTELAELAGGFIHEIKNHLSTFGLNLQLLAEDFNDPQTQRERRAFERVQRLQNECERLVEVSNDFLRFSRIEELNLQPCDLLLILEELIDFFGPMARSSNIKVNRYLPSDLPAVYLDSEIFKQALLNLLLNAEQAMPKGGEITIQAIISPDNITLNLIDTGKGISQEGLDKIFKPFYSTRPGGTGLGLPTTKKIVEAHGGTIEVQSEPGKGTKFSIRLPLKIPKGL